MKDMLFFGINKWRGKAFCVFIPNIFSFVLNLLVMSAFPSRRKQLAQLGSATGVYKTLVKYLVGVPQVFFFLVSFFACALSL